MKRFIALLILIAGLLLLSPLLIGGQARKYTDDYLAKMQEVPGYEVSMLEYKRGYLASTAQFSIKGDTSALASILDTAEPDLEDEVMQNLITLMEEGVLVNAHIAHGPLTIASTPQVLLFHAQLEFEGAVKNFIDQAQQELGLLEPLVNADVFMGFNGEGQMLLRSPAFDYDTEDGNLAFGGMEWSFNILGGGEIIEYDGQLHAITAVDSTSNEEMRLSPLVFSGITNFDTSLAMGTGSFSMSMESMQLKSSASMIELKNLVAGAEIEAPGEDLVSIGYTLAFDSLEGNQLPDALTNFRAKIALNNLNAIALAKFSNQSMFADPTTNPAMFQAQMMELVTEVFANNPEIQVEDFGFELGEQINMSMHGSLSFANNALANPMVMQNPFMLLNEIISDINLDFSQGLLSFALDSFIENQMDDAQLAEESRPQFEAQMRAQIQMGLDQSIQAGFLIKESDQYRVKAAMSNGSLEVNGIPVPLPF